MEGGLEKAQGERAGDNSWFCWQTEPFCRPSMVYRIQPAQAVTTVERFLSPSVWWGSGLLIPLLMLLLH